MTRWGWPWAVAFSVPSHLVCARARALPTAHLAKHLLSLCGATGVTSLVTASHFTARCVSLSPQETPAQHPGVPVSDECVNQ